jgi:hypothetical protein
VAYEAGRDSGSGWAAHVAPGDLRGVGAGPLGELKHLTSRPLTWLGGLLVAGSAGALFGSWSDTIQAAFRRTVGLPDADVPQPLLVGLLISGVLLVLFDQVYLARRDGRAGKRLLAIRHTSLNPATVPHLRPSELPKEGGPWDLEPVDCDLTLFLSGGSLHVSSAVAQQQRIWNLVEAQLRGSKPPQLAYYGVAHIPLQILAGRQLAHSTLSESLIISMGSPIQSPVG